MPSKKRKYNARFPAGRIKKIMQTDEEVGKVAQAVPVIISRTLELFVESLLSKAMQVTVARNAKTLSPSHVKQCILAESRFDFLRDLLFVESLLSKAMQVTVARNAKTLSPSHVKQCILAESRFDFLRDLVKNIPDVSAAEEKEMQMSAESSPNSSRFSDTSVPPRRIVREDSNSSSSCDVKVQPLRDSKDNLKRAHSADEPRQTVTSTIVSTDAAIDLSTKKEEKTIRANFYQETLIDQVQHRSVITINPTYNNPIPQPSTSSYASMTPVEPMHRIEVPKPEIKPLYFVDLKQNNNIAMTPPRTPVTPILNIDFTKNLTNPEIKVLDTAVANIVGVKERPKEKLQRQNSKSYKAESKREIKPPPIDIDHINSGNLQIDEDYDT